MSNISRRDFLKTAGVMTLAVAAAGVLAGCEGNAAKPEVPEETANSVTIGDFTVTLKETKYISFKKYTEDTSAPNEVRNDYRYVLVLGYLKSNDPTQQSTPAFEAKPVVENLGDVVYGNGSILNAVAVQNLFGLNDTVVEAKNVWKKKNNSTKEGTPFYYVYQVASDENKNLTYSKAPSFRLLLNDTTNYLYKELKAVIPAEPTNVAWKEIVNG